MAQNNDDAKLSATRIIEEINGSTPYNSAVYERTIPDSQKNAKSKLISTRQDVVSEITDSTKFFAGDIFNFLDDTLEETAIDFLGNGIDILPFEKNYFEFLNPYCLTYESKNTTHQQVDERPYWMRFSKIVVLASSNKTRKFNTRTLFFCPAEDGFDIAMHDVGIDNQGMLVSQDAWGDRQPVHYGDSRFPTHEDETFIGYRAALGLCTFLMSRDSKIVERRPPAGLNAHRVKKGKVPFFSHHVVTIDPQRIVYEGGNGSQPGGPKRTSPRLHWRRGHVRTLTSGKKIGIPPSIIGAKNGGGGPMIDKTYRVRTDHAQG